MIGILKPISYHLSQEAVSADTITDSNLIEASNQDFNSF